MVWLWWIGGAVALGVVEMFTLDLFFLMLAGGAAAAAIPCALGAPLWAQVLTFAVVSLLLLFAVRPWALRHLKRSTPDAPVGIAAHVGKPAVVVAEVSDAGGRVKLAGEVWTARSEDPAAVYPVGADVTVVEIDGATAVIAPAGAAPPSGASAG